ncbi:MAG: DUF4388 domain-containing protein [Myxococcota bacterium]|nr:DUF4388 domain-containing protein [Myxococcota bacterium]
MAQQTILLVDSDAQHMRVMEVSLRKAGFGVVTARTVKDAEAVCGRETPRLIIAETNIAGESGLDLCQRLKDNVDTRDIPFVFLTKDTRVDTKVSAMQLGVDDYVLRPIYTQELVGRVSLILNKKARKDMVETEERKRFFGDLDAMGVLDLIRRMQQSRRSASVHISGPHHRGTVWFRDGVIIDATTGRLTGTDAVYRMIRWESGAFEIDFRTPQRPTAITQSTDDLLMEGLRRVDEWAKVAEQLPPLSVVFGVNYDILADRLSDLPDETNRLIRLFDGRRTANEVVAESDVADLETLEWVSQLYFEGIISTEQASPSDDGPRDVPDYHRSVPPASVPSIADSLLQTASEMQPIKPSGQTAPLTSADSAPASPIPPPPAEAFEAKSESHTVDAVRPTEPMPNSASTTEQRSLWELKRSVDNQDANTISTVPPEHLTIMNEEDPPFPEFDEDQGGDDPGSVDDDFFGGGHYQATVDDDLYGGSHLEDEPDDEDAPSTRGPKIAVGMVAAIVLGFVFFVLIRDEIEPISISSAALQTDWHSQAIKKMQPVAQTAPLKQNWHIPNEPNGGPRPDGASTGTGESTTTPNATVAAEGAPAAPAEKATQKAPQPVSAVKVEINKDAKILIAKGVKQYEKLAFENAADTFEKALAISPSAVPALVAYSKTLIELNRVRDALVASEKAIQLDPNNAEAHLFVGNARQEIGNQKGAIQAYEEYLKLAPNGQFSGELKQIVKGIKAEIGQP